MFWLGLISSVAFVPGYTGATIPTGWAVLSCLLPLTLWSKARLGLLHWVLFLFVAYAAVSLAWTPSLYEGIYGFWMLAIGALAFRLGSTDLSLPDLYRGLAWGLSASSAVAAFQWFYFEPVLHLNWYPPGLLYNSANLGATCGLVIVALATERLWWHTALVAPALALSQSRAGIAIVAIGLLATKVRSPAIIGIVTLVGFTALTFHPSPSDIERFNIWNAAYLYLTPFGNGVGSFLNVWISTSKGILLPEYVHNEFLQLAFEFGIGAIVPTAAILYYLRCSEATGWPCLVAFSGLACIAYPFHFPLTLLVGAAAAGRIASDWDSFWFHSRLRRLAILPRIRNWKSRDGSVRGAALPLQSRTS